jgi:hypothetical protein
LSIVQEVIAGKSRLITENVTGPADVRRTNSFARLIAVRLTFGTSCHFAAYVYRNVANEQIASAAVHSIRLFLFFHFSLRVGPVAPKLTHLFLQHMKRTLARFGSGARHRILAHRIFNQMMQRCELADWIGGARISR